jgi:hypothetical protein
MRPFGATKRQKEMARAEYREEKKRKKEQRKQEKEQQVRTDGVDPDLVGLVPGPQPRPDDE